MSANITHNNGKDCSSVMLRQLIPAFIFLTLFHPPPRLPSLLLCQLLWGGLEGMLMASCPHTPRPHMPLVGMWLFTTKAYWNFTPPMLWVFFFPSPRPPPHPIAESHLSHAPLCISHSPLFSFYYSFWVVVVYYSHCCSSQWVWRAAMGEMTLLGLLQVWMRLCEYITRVSVALSSRPHTKSHWPPTVCTVLQLHLLIIQA